MVPDSRRAIVKAVTFAGLTIPPRDSLSNVPHELISPKE